jgi:hypothetical protein
MKKMLVLVFISSLALFLFIQLAPYGKDHTRCFSSSRASSTRPWRR